MSFSTDQLIALQALVAKELASRGGSSSSSSALVKAKKVKKEKDPSAKPRKAGAWAGWTAHCPKEHAAEYETFKASSEKKQGIAPLFCTQWRKDHADEYAAFEGKWKEEHSSAATSAASSPASTASASVAASVAAHVAAPVAAAASAAPEAKVRKPQSEETKAAAALKRAATKAKKAAEATTAVAKVVAAAAPAPLPAPVATSAPEEESEAEAEEDEEAPELLPFKLGGRSYLRPGVLRDGGITSWATGDLWESKKGVKGDWAGVLQEDGSIDLNADEPEC
jgi:hypothetical protein